MNTGSKKMLHKPASNFCIAQALQQLADDAVPALVRPLGHS